jgi:hypothetical protein
MELPLRMLGSVVTQVLKNLSLFYYGSILWFQYFLTKIGVFKLKILYSCTKIITALVFNKIAKFFLKKLVKIAENRVPIIDLGPPVKTHFSFIFLLPDQNPAVTFLLIT